MKLKKCKAVIVGDVGVGKTSLIKKYVYDEFSEDYKSSLGLRIDRKTVNLESGENIKFIIWDLAGEIFSYKMYQNYVKGAHAIIGVYDLCRDQTYEHINGEMKTIINENDNIISAMVGNKSDLKNKIDLRDQGSYDINLATSAKTGFQIEDLFMNIAKKMTSRS